jgi:hypothetical protein
MATTPAANGSFFDDFTKSVVKRNAKGDHFMSLTNHSLVCAECMAADKSRDCSHKLYLIPPWKSLFQLERMAEHVPLKKRAQHEQEVFGVIGREGGTYYKPSLVRRTFSITNTKTVSKLPENIVL